MPINLIIPGIEKARVSFDLLTFLKTFYSWKDIIKKGEYAVTTYGTHVTNSRFILEFD